MHYLAQRPALQDDFRARPEMIRPSIEEILRLETPVIAMPRCVTKDVVIEGSHLKTGQRLLLNWASANRDGTVFENPAEFSATRKPNNHLVFGMGIHSCLGAPLARQELLITVQELLSRTSRFSVAEEPQLMRMHHYGFASLPVSLHA